MIITPKSKLLQVLDAYPMLEDLLISYVPVFKELKNPILRKTVARIATLQQVASIGHVKVEDLINLLRKEIGQDLYSGNEQLVFVTQKPDWFSQEKVTKKFDIRNMLSEGDQPVNQVMSDLNNMRPGAIYELIAPFVPAPLIEKASSLKIDHWIAKDEHDRVLIYFKI